MDHVSYEKMPHSSANWKFAGPSNNPTRVKWCVTEKCHGANFCFHCDGDKIFYAKRTSLISSNDEFFGYKSMARKLKQQILDSYNAIITNKSMRKRYIDTYNHNKNELYQLNHISIYGEIFGGFYPISKSKLNEIKNGKNRNKKSNKKQPIIIDNEQKNDNDDNDDNKNDNNFVVQREILYSPNIDFYAFDIAITLKDRNNNKTRRQYINYQDAISIFESVKMFYAKPLYIGKYEDCCNYNYEFQTNIPKWLGLPSLSKEFGKNMAEGIVIKPMKNIYIEGKGKKLKRPIVKHKNKSFNERISKLNHEFGKFDNRNLKNQRSNIMKGKDMINTECLLNMINNNRYQSVISKHGNPSWNKKNKNKKPSKKQTKIDDDNNFYVKAIVDDVYDDIKNDKGSVINQWWNKNVITNKKLKKYIDNKMIEKAVEVIIKNRH